MDNPFAQPDGDDDVGTWSWPHRDADLLGRGNEWRLVATMGWQRDRWLGYVGGYRKAAGIILQDVARTGRNQDYLIYPFLMCWRHYVELQLKMLVSLLQRYRLEPSEVLKTHKLNLLWSRTRKLLEEAVPEEDQTTLDNVERVLLQLHSFDPTSEHFRYPVNTQGAETMTNLPRIDMSAFHDAMDGVANYLDAADTGLRVMIDQQEDYLRDTALHWE